MSEEIEELTAETEGTWQITTQGTIHEWDVDNMTYKRMPGPESHAGVFVHDGRYMQITKVERWPKVGDTFFIWCDDPDDMFTERWRQSSTIVSIVKIEATE